jgi:ADP-ribose pyrophosphatase YjhB (NUDIX family)
MKQEFAIPAVGALIYNRSGKLFLMKSSGKYGDSWLVPGGKVQFGETMEEALCREVFEETRMNLHKIEFLGSSEHINIQRHFIFLEFRAEVLAGSAIRLNYEAVEYGWFEKEEILQLELFQGTKSLVDRHWMNHQILQSHIV